MSSQPWGLLSVPLSLGLGAGLGSLLLWLGPGELEPQDRGFRGAREDLRLLGGNMFYSPSEEKVHCVAVQVQMKESHLFFPKCFPYLRRLPWTASRGSSSDRRRRTVFILTGQWTVDSGQGRAGQGAVDCSHLR